MHSLRPLVPLLLAAGILLAGNGLIGTLIALRGAIEGFSAPVIGFMGTAYFAGFLIGCIFISRMMRAVGHIRAFSALAAIAASASLIMAMAVDPYVWTAMRFAHGICFSGLFTIVESWINAGVENRDRARVLAVYRIVDISAVTGSQFLIPAFGAGSFTLFGIMAIMVTMSLVPVSLGDRSNPSPPEFVKLDLKRAWAISPLAVSGCIAVGLSNSAFRMTGPIYAERIGMNTADIAVFLSLGIVGGALVQYPLGALSDRWDRRRVVLIATIGAMVSSIALFALSGSDLSLNFLLVFVFGAFAMPIYSLAVAHANDHAEPHEYVLTSAALLLFYSLGAIVGPFAGSLVIENLGAHWLFAYCAAVYALFTAFTLYRMRARPGVPESRRGRFAALLRTSPIIGRLARRDK